MGSGELSEAVGKVLDQLASVLADYLHAESKLQVHALTWTPEATAIYIDDPQLAGHITRRVTTELGDVQVVVDHATRGPVSVELIQCPTSNTRWSAITTLKTLSST